MKKYQTTRHNRKRPDSLEWKMVFKIRPCHINRETYSPQRREAQVPNSCSRVEEDHFEVGTNSAAPLLPLLYIWAAS